MISEELYILQPEPNHLHQSQNIQSMTIYVDLYSINRVLEMCVCYSRGKLQVKICMLNRGIPRLIIVTFPLRSVIKSNGFENGL